MDVILSGVDMRLSPNLANIVNQTSFSVPDGETKKKKK
jgi:hypothetical protein